MEAGHDRALIKPLNLHTMGIQGGIQGAAQQTEQNAKTHRKPETADEAQRDNGQGVGEGAYGDHRFCTEGVQQAADQQCSCR
ncbi:hypothetical protein D3C80_1787230 [compost metagenome]